ncbi:hypothetical protein PG993_000383 [Apiospora rasikravindrae]|uniref:Uncharacterized protein n=1 Tax=Apiospora rasikravindrae TaxID=990691 RepID=A0ABR1U8F1_9PEZI
MIPAATDSGTGLATRSFGLSRGFMTGKESTSLAVSRGEAERVPPAVAMMVILNTSGEGRALQTYSGNIPDGYHVDSTNSRASVSKSALPLLAAFDEDSDAAKRDRAKSRRFRIMASLGAISAIATVALAVFTALNFYASTSAKATT